MAKIKVKTEADEMLDESGLTERNKIFCREYIFDWNGSRAYKVGYPNTTDGSARTLAERLLTKVDIKKYIEFIQKDLEKLAGISRMKVISEHMKMAFSSIAHLHNTWIELRQFELLTQEQKDCIAEIDTKTERKYFAEYDPDKKDFVKVPYDIKYVKIKLYDKQKSLDAINKMLGYDVAIEIKHSGEIGTYDTTDARNKLAASLVTLPDKGSESETPNNS